MARARAGARLAPRIRLLAGALCLCGAVAGASPLEAQVSERDPTIDNLPRLGYEFRTFTAGEFVIKPTIEGDVTYNSNVFALPTDKRGDAIFELRPSLIAQRKDPRLDVRADLHADVMRYATYSLENLETFGASLDATKAFGSRQSVGARIAFDRAYERRSDPEALNDPSRPPSLINALNGELRYDYQGARFTVGLTAAATDMNYLSPAEANRDLSTYRATARIGVNLRSGIGVYVEPYVNRRQFHLPVSQGGFVDATTFGVLGGVSFNLTGKLTGNLGIGVFHDDPDGTQTPSFSGLAANGRLVWRPRVRTSVVFNAFRGDVATVRLGALGRIDTTASLALEQEVRHNLLLHAEAGVRDLKYRGIDRNQRYVSGELEARYLVNRYLSATLGGDYLKRTADRLEDRFDRAQVKFGLRFVL